MNDAAEQWVTIATGLDEARATELALVLTARGISSQRQRGLLGIELWVPLEEAAAAAAELTQYRQENARAIGPRRLEEVGDGWPGVAFYVVVLVAVFAALREGFFALDWLTAGRLDSAAVRAGEWWRVVTALTVHLDLDHIGGNLAFGSFFGYFAGRYLGRGVGWLTILTAGSAANALNALLQPPTHRSLGASTAVFAALGILAAYTWRRGFLRETPWRARIAPIVAAIGLLAFTGTAGENTDLGAHLLGFVMGFASGVALARWASVDWLRSARTQTVSATVAIAIIVAAWCWGLAVAG